MSMTLSLRDRVLQKAFPMVMAPHEGGLDPIEGFGKRLIAAADGVYLEARSPALHLLLKVQDVEIAFPFGSITPFVRPLHGPIPAALLHEFIHQSIHARPDETAAIILAGPNGYRMECPRIETASGGHVRYYDEFDDDEIVMDLHSHGLGKAFFSGTDDASDRSRRGPYLAVVAGYSETYSTTPLVIRAVCGNYLIPLHFSDTLVQGAIQ